jgi:hypothetical protein
MSMMNIDLHPSVCPNCNEEPCICNPDHRLRRDPSEDEPRISEEEGYEGEDAD